MVIESQSLAQKRNIEGYTYQQERGFEIAEKAAQNEGAGNFSSAGIGLGMMAGIGGAIGNTIGGTFGIAMNSINQSASSSVTEAGFCDNCGAALVPGVAFCEECGTPVLAKPSCKKCGYVYERPGKFCPKCGTKREA